NFGRLLTEGVHPCAIALRAAIDRQLWLFVRSAKLNPVSQAKAACSLAAHSVQHAVDRIAAVGYVPFETIGPAFGVRGPDVSIHFSGENARFESDLGEC